MGLIEILITAIIATYAMTGGALISASITAPDNTKRLLSRATMSLHENISRAGAVLCPLLAFAISTVYGPFSSGASLLAYNPMVWWAVAHVIFIVLILVCRRIANYLAEAD